MADERLNKNPGANPFFFEKIPRLGEDFQMILEAPPNRFLLRENPAEEGKIFTAQGALPLKKLRQRLIQIPGCQVSDVENSHAREFTIHFHKCPL